MPEPDSTPDYSRQFLKFVQEYGRDLRVNDEPPKTLDAWKEQRIKLRDRLIGSMGGFPKEACPLEPQVLGEFERDGYRVQKLLLQTRPGILMTANAYVPDGEGRRAAVLCVHGHWRQAKQEPVVQERCIGLAKLGFFVLMVDAFGAGERGIGKALGEYHGEMVAATLWPTGLALAGLQCYDNMRAVDYLQTRPEVDPDRIGVTGCSGGGNQTMYVGALDERLKCVVPCCSVGTYQAYLGAACCMGEVVPSALTYTEEASVLALVAPRALMLINATKDAFQFSVGEARKSLANAQPIFSLYDKADRTAHVVVDAGHGYNQEMREAMYGWMTKHLKGEGDGSPIAEPEIKTEAAETLRCFPANSRPDDFVTLPQFAATEARRILATRPVPDHAEMWRADQMMMRAGLTRVLNDPSTEAREEWNRGNLSIEAVEGGLAIEAYPEPGISVFALHQPAEGERRGIAVLLDVDKCREAATTPLASALRKAGWDLLTVDLRATGKTAYGSDKIGRAPDHNTAEWSLWIGRPLLGQWVDDVAYLIEGLAEREEVTVDRIALIGSGPASLVALCVGAYAATPVPERRRPDYEVAAVVTVGGLASYVSDVPYENQRLAIMVPDILEQVGDIPQIASLAAPQRLVIAGGVDGTGSALAPDKLRENYRWTRAAYQLQGKQDQLTILPDDELEPLVDALE